MTRKIKEKEKKIVAQHFQFVSIYFSMTQFWGLKRKSEL